MIRALVTGCSGQVGAEVTRELRGRAHVLAHDRRSLDLSKPDDIVARIRDARPALIINAAAYTAVDRAESEIERARSVNVAAVSVLAEEAKRVDALLVHYSTDYVFDGTKRAPYVESDIPRPINAYGITKLEGERAIAASGCEHVILRTSWIYGAHGHNFLLTMLRLAQTKKEIEVVDDQRGAPTSSRQLACATLAVLAGVKGRGEISAADLGRAKEASGLYHASAAGETTWFGFAQAIFEARARQLGGAFEVPRLIALTTAQYPTPAQRPANSVLANTRLAEVFGVHLAPWREGLDEALALLAEGVPGR